MKQSKLYIYRVVSVLSLIIVCSHVMGQVAVAPLIDELRVPFSAKDVSMFATPPKINYPQTWFHFISGNVSELGVAEDMEAIAKAGFSGVQLFHGQFGGAWPGVEPQITALSPQWDELVKHVAQNAKKLGLRFTMQNCSGWATSGGPWIKPSNAMRHLIYSRTDVSATNSNILLTRPQPSNEPWRDYKDVAVVAFPTPLGDSRILQPQSVESNRDLAWKNLLSGTNQDAVYVDPCKGGDTIRIDVTYPSEVTVRTIEFPSINQVNHHRCYEPGITLSLDAILPNGRIVRVMNGVLPASNSQDNCPISYACSGEIKTNKYRVSILNKHHMTLRSLKMMTAARKNSWESEAAWTMRNLERHNTYPQQNHDAYIDPDGIVDLTQEMNVDGSLNWKVPKGKWTILRIGHVNTGRQNSPAPAEGTGWECNKLSSSGAKAQFAGYIGRLNKDPLANGLLDGMLLDSWECETQTWTDEMEKTFEKINNYQLRKWLPAVIGFVIDDQEITARFLRDWRGTISRMFIDNFYGTMSQLAKENGLSITYETAAGDVFPADILEYYKYADVPMCEFWQPFTQGYVGSLNFKPIKPTASAAHFYGKPRVAAEAFTSFSHTWDEQWSMLKEVANNNLVEGVTHLVYHTYTHNPQKPFLPPGTSFGGHGIGTPFLRGQTWWKYMPVINAYFARCSYMMERGRPVSDIIWYMGDEISPKPDQNPNFLQGYKYDYCNPDILMNRLSVENGNLLTPDGITYRVLWLPNNYRMLPETLEKILSFIEQGATVIGNVPNGVATLNGGSRAQKRFYDAVRKIWGKNNVAEVRNIGKGKIISMPVLEALTVAGISPDIRGNVLWNHRQIDGADWYFVCPQKGEKFSGTLDFRNSGYVEIWDPTTGKVSAVRSDSTDGRTKVAINLPQSGSCYVVFRKDVAVSMRHKPLKSKCISTIKPAKNWTLHFPEGFDVPQSMELTELLPWKNLDMSDQGKAFSGTATYETIFKVLDKKDNQSFVLDLGRVEMIASVFVNGVEMQTLWAPPYRADITSCLKQGDNTIRIDVTNTWFNRLVYDAKQPIYNRKTWAIRQPAPDSPLRDSGLLGPVYIEQKEEVSN